MSALSHSGKKVPFRKIRIARRSKDLFPHHVDAQTRDAQAAGHGGDPMTMITTVITALSLLLGHPAIGGPGIKCDAATIQALQSRLPLMSNLDAQSFASARLAAAREALDSGDAKACSEALDHARKDMGVAGESAPPTEVSAPPPTMPAVKS
jgi:hypothetical protein